MHRQRLTSTWYSRACHQSRGLCEPLRLWVAFSWLAPLPTRPKRKATEVALDVESVDAAVTTVMQKGGRVLMGLHQAP